MTKRWAVAQVNAGRDVKANLETAVSFIEEAAGGGCSLIAFPELFLQRGAHQIVFDNNFSLGGPNLTELCAAAKRSNINVIAGSVPLRGEDNELYNTALFINSRGEIIETYRKIHLFDVDLPGKFKIQESAHLDGGTEVQKLEFDGVRCGIAICYDLRFAELFRRLSTDGAQVIFVPANFTFETGKAHWEPLLRARAIENQCYIVAPAQCGQNPDTGVQSYGHSLVVDPWGEVVASAGEEEEWFDCTLDLQYIEAVRKKLPALDHVELRDK